MGSPIRMLLVAEATIYPLDFYFRITPGKESLDYVACVHQLLIRHLHLNDQIASLVENLLALLSTVSDIKVGC